MGSMRDFLMDGGVARIVATSGHHRTHSGSRRATRIAVPMPKQETAPSDENNREPDDVSDDALSVLKVARLVLEVMVLVTRLLKTL